MAESVPVVLRFTLKRHSRRPYLRCRLKDKDGNVFDLTGATGVKFEMKNSEGTLVIDEDGTIESPPTLGIIRYEWKAGDTENAGEYHAEFDIMYPVSESLTVPTNGDILIKIYEDVNNA